MDKPKFFCAVDLGDPCVLSCRSSLRIKGWVIARDGARIDSVRVEVNGRRVGAAFPTPRADVSHYYAGIANAAASGFVSRRIRLDPRQGQQLDVRIVVRCEGVRHTVLARHFRIVWFDPENELFPLQHIGPFLSPDDFDSARLAAHPGRAPVFILSAQAHPARAALRALGHEFSDGRFALDVLRAVVECHDVYHAYRKRYFVHLESDLKAYAIGRFDLYNVINGLVALLDRRLHADAAGDRPIHWLCGKDSLLAVPLLRAIYPNAKFICVRQSFASLTRDRIRSGGEALRVALSNDHADPDPYQSVWNGHAYEDLLRIVQGGHSSTGRTTPLPVAQVRDADRLLAELGLRAAAAPPAAAHSTSPSAQPAAGSAESDAPRTGGDGLDGLPRFAEPSPIFVLGAGRSGTSAMVGAIKAAGIDGFHEGHVFPMLNEMLQRASRQVDGSMRAPILGVIAQATVEPVYGGDGPRVWVAKTPDHAMIDCVSLIRAIYPRARFVMMRRHPVSFAESRRRKFGEPLLSAINEWIKCIESWKAMRSNLPVHSYQERDARDLKDARLNDELSNFLDLDTQQRKSFADYLAAERPEFTRMQQDVLAAFSDLADDRLFNARSIFYQMLDSVGEHLEDTDWSSEQKEKVERMLGTLPAEFGYALHRPDHHLPDLLVSWSRTIEQYRHTAEYHERNTQYWAEMAENWRLEAEFHERNVRYWVETAENLRTAAEGIPEIRDAGDNGESPDDGVRETAAD